MRAEPQAELSDSATVLARQVKQTTGSLEWGQLGLRPYNTAALPGIRLRWELICASSWTRHSVISPMTTMDSEAHLSHSRLLITKFPGAPLQEVKVQLAHQR